MKRLNDKELLSLKPAEQPEMFDLAPSLSAPEKKFFRALDNFYDHLEKEKPQLIKVKDKTFRSSFSPKRRNAHLLSSLRYPLYPIRALMYKKLKQDFDQGIISHELALQIEDSLFFSKESNAVKALASTLSKFDLEGLPPKEHLRSLVNEFIRHEDHAGPMQEWMQPAFDKVFDLSYRSLRLFDALQTSDALKKLATDKLDYKSSLFTDQDIDECRRAFVGMFSFLPAKMTISSEKENSFIRHSKPMKEAVEAAAPALFDKLIAYEAKMGFAEKREKAEAEKQRKEEIDEAERQAALALKEQRKTASGANKPATEAPALPAAASAVTGSHASGSINQPAPTAYAETDHVKEERDEAERQAAPALNEQRKAAPPANRPAAKAPASPTAPVITDPVWYTQLMSELSKFLDGFTCRYGRNNITIQHNIHPECRLDLAVKNGNGAPLPEVLNALKDAIKHHTTFTELYLDSLPNAEAMGFTIDRTAQPPVLSHQEQGIRVPLSGSATTLYDAVSSAIHTYDNKALERIMQEELAQLARCAEEETKARSAAQAAAEPQKTAAIPQPHHQKLTRSSQPFGLSPAEQNIFVPDLCTLESFMQPRQAPNLKNPQAKLACKISDTWMEVPEQTMELPNTTFVVPLFIAYWEAQHRVAHMLPTGGIKIRNDARPSNDPSRLDPKKIRRHYIAEISKHLFANASRARLDENGNIKFIPGANPNLVIWESALDRELMNKIDAIYNDASLSPARKEKMIDDQFVGKGMGEDCIEAFVKECPYFSPVTIISDDHNFLRRRTVSTTGSGFPVGEACFGSYLGAELGARGHALGKRLNEPNLSKKEVWNRIDEHNLAHGTYTPPLSNHSKTGQYAPGLDTGHPAQTIEQIIRHGVTLQKAMENGNHPSPENLYPTIAVNAFDPRKIEPLEKLTHTQTEPAHRMETGVTLLPEPTPTSTPETRLRHGFTPQPYLHPDSQKLLTHLKTKLGINSRVAFHGAPGKNDVTLEMRCHAEQGPSGLYATLHSDNPETLKAARALTAQYAKHLARIHRAPSEESTISR